MVYGPCRGVEIDEPRPRRSAGKAVTHGQGAVFETFDDIRRRGDDDAPKGAFVSVIGEGEHVEAKAVDVAYEEPRPVILDQHPLWIWFDPIDIDPSSFRELVH